MTGKAMLTLPALLLALSLGAGCGGADKPAGSGDSGTQDGTGPKSDKKKKNGKNNKDGKGPNASESAEGEDATDAGEEAESGEEGQPKFDMSVPDPEPKEDKPCDIDFLFVVDNSRSMVDNQKSLANSVPDFIETIQKDIPNLESYHIGVISTDESQYNVVGDVKQCKRMGGLIVRTADYTPGAELPFDRPCHPYANGKHFMTGEDDLEEKFTCAAKLGPMGSGNERPMDAIEAAMSEDLTKKDACNEGFFREKAILVVVLVSDEEDDIEVEDGFTNGSKGEPKDWYERVLKFKDNKEELVVVLSLVGKPKPNKCDYTYEPGGEPKDGAGIKSAEVSRRLIEFTEKFGKRGVVGDICADNYDAFFKKAVTTLALACEDIPR